MIQVRRRPPPLVSPTCFALCKFAFSLLFWFPTFHPRIFAGVLFYQVTGKFYEDALNTLHPYDHMSFMGILVLLRTAADKEG